MNFLGFLLLSFPQLYLHEHLGLKSQGIVGLLLFIFECGDYDPGKPSVGTSENHIQNNGVLEALVEHC